MKKKIAVILACLLSFALGVCVCIVIPNGQAATKPDKELDRSPTLKYQIEDYKTYKPCVYIEAKGDGRFYHRTPTCDFVYMASDAVPIKMHTYEAVERGFDPCPDCINELVEIYDYDKYYRNR